MSLKPKHHFLVHYLSVILASGPRWNMSSMRFESKNRESKITSRVAISCVNVCRTIADKNQLRLNYQFLCSKAISPWYYDIEDVRSLKINDFPEVESYKELLLSMHKQSDIFCTTQMINFGGYEITQKCIIMIPSENGPDFFYVTAIVITKREKFFVVAKLLKDVYFDHHTQAFEILNERCEWRLLLADELFGYVKTHVVNLSAKSYVVKNWY